MIKYLVALLAALIASPAFAVWDAVIPSGVSVLEYTTGGVTFSNGPGTGSMFQGRTFTTPATGATRAAAALASEQLSIGVGGNQLAVTATRSISMAALAEGVVAVGAAAYVGVQAGAVLNTLIGQDSAVSIGATRCTPSLSGWQCDSGVAPTDQQKTCYRGPKQGTAPRVYPSFQGCIGTLSEAARADWSQEFIWQGYGANYNVGGVVCDQPTKTCTVQMTNKFNGSLTQYNWQMGAELTTTQQCPASIDALNPAWSVPSGAAPDADGKCRTGRYSGAAPTYVKDRIANYGDPTKAAAAAQDVMNKGGTITGAEPTGITGPASKPGTPTSTTTTTPNPAGGTSTTTTTSTPTTNYTYSPTSITYNITTVTTTNTDGKVTTTTGTEGAQVSDECKANPDIAGCAKLGEPPKDTVNPDHKNIDFTPESIGVGSFCPSPYLITFRGWQFVLDYQAACNVAPLIRPGLLALTALSCLILVIGTCARS